MKSKLFALFAIFLVTYLSADTYLENCTSPLVPQTEFEELGVILIKYGNNPDGIPALHYAILQNDKFSVDLLLKYGASPFTKDFRQNNCLYYAIKAGNLEMTQRFVELGIDPDEFSNGKTALHIAIVEHQTDIVRYLINYGVQINPKGATDYLNICAIDGTLEIYKLLVSHGVESEYGKIFLASLIIGDDHPIYYANNPKYEQEKTELFAYLIDQYIIDPNDRVNNIPLLYYVTNPSYGTELLKVFLERGANANVLDQGSQGGNVFHNVRNLIQESTEHFDEQKAMIQLLVQYGADINHKDLTGNIPLKYAQGSRMITFLKRLGAK